MKLVQLIFDRRITTPGACTRTHPRMSLPSMTVFGVLMVMLPLLTDRAVPAGTPVHEASGCFGSGQATLDRAAGPFDGFFDADGDADGDAEADGEAVGCDEVGDGAGTGGSTMVARGAPLPPLVRIT